MAYSKDINKIIEGLDKAKSERYTFDNLLQDVTDYVMPHRTDFNRTQQTGKKRTTQLFDATAPTSAELLASTIVGTTTSSGTRWFELGIPGKDVDLDGAKWLQLLTDKVFDVLNSPTGNFGPNNHEVILDWTCYGTGILFCDEDLRSGVRFKSYTLSDVYLDENFMGAVDTVYRKNVCRTVKQAHEKWGEKIGPKLMRLYKSDPTSKVDILHYVTRDYQEETNFPYKSCYIDLDSKTYLEEGGFFEMPYMIPRYSKLSGEKYGRGPAISALSDIKMLNAIAETSIRGMRRAINPVLLTTNDDSLRPLRLNSTDIQTIRGGIDPITGNPLIRPLESNPQIQLAITMLDMYKNTVKDAFFVNKILSTERPTMTATEVMQLRDERLQLMSPQFVRLQSEYFEPLITRIVGIILRSGGMPDAPPTLVDQTGSLNFDIDYVGPLARAQRASQITTLNRLIESVGPLAQLDPTILDRIDGDAAIKKHSDLLGLPADLLRTDKDLAGLRQSRQQAQQQAQVGGVLADAAPKMLQEAAKQR